MNTIEAKEQKKEKLLTYEEALGAVEKQSQTLGCETVPLMQSLKRVTSKPIKASFDLPRFNNSAVDGYGVLVEDLLGAGQEHATSLTLHGEIAAGTKDAALVVSDPENQAININPGQTIRILTGAPVPPSVEAVVMKEFCKLNDTNQVQFFTKAKIGENIRMQGEEIETGATVLPAGTKINPPTLGLLATLGMAQIPVYKNPRVAIVATGDELIEPGEPLGPGQIYNSNSYALEAALNGLGIYTVSRFHITDNKEAVKALLKKLLQDFDLLITAGGVSVGEHDYIKAALEELRVKTIFWRCAIKPGKPVYFGTYEQNTNTETATKITESQEQSQKPEAELSSNTPKTLVFGLPGNPVSALVTFQLFIKPALAIMSGQKGKAPLLPARALRSLKKKAGRLDFVRGQLKILESGEITVMPTTGQDSHMLTGLAGANCLLHFEQEKEFLAEGSSINVAPLNWFE
jgi:molybdopterin molybdotransferase